LHAIGLDPRAGACFPIEELVDIGFGDLVNGVGAPPRHHVTLKETACFSPPGIADMVVDMLLQIAVYHHLKRRLLLHLLGAADLDRVDTRVRGHDCLSRPLPGVVDLRDCRCRPQSLHDGFAVNPIHRDPRSRALVGDAQTKPGNESIPVDHPPFEGRIQPLDRELCENL
jgi:hypothetical protein